MINVNKKLVIASVLLSIASLTSIAYATHSWGDYHWARTSNPFTLKLGDNVSSSWDPYLITTSNDWSISTVLDTIIVPGQAKANCRPTAGRVEVCNKNYGNNGWLGIAQVWVNSAHHIVQGAVKMNDTYFNTATYNVPSWRNFVMCQEVGHTLGLDHQDEIFNNLNLGTCMDYTNNPLSNQHPNAHDYEELAILYAHVDGGTTLRADLPQQGNNHSADFTNSSEWGKSLRQDNKQRDIVFARKLEDNTKLFTFVIWAD